ncbi:ABC transporter related [Staphylothermus marinus F1]|uniref:ABC transporter related n=1 Tax=Staphylothermus marinus (strain ATCC 43588 / DSM 3639 / JCM 9404 / F1) TaxID=399550 RepID=A3DNN1_STAMF|nr:ABC transporter ATP-binding protein [Staphylothermus marinus]ABN70241.1 ABC transporter related [Staphylothermus marinus F1]
MADVELRNVTKRFGKTIAVDNVSFKVYDKEFFVLLGPSGSGKTTTLRIIAGLEDPDEGDVLIYGKVVNDVPPHKRDIAMVFQNYALYPHMTVYKNLSFPLENMGLSKTEIDRRVKAVAEMLHISHLLDRKPSQLSGGEQQRVALGRALVRRPSVFLMDEPLSNLDAKLRVYMRAQLKRMQKELGITTIYVTHDQAEAMTMGDRIAVMNKGKIMQIGRPYDLYNKPANLFVAGFIGSPPMNFFDAAFKVVNNEYILDAGEFTLKLDKEIGRIILEKLGETDVIVGIRPEHIDIVNEKEENTIEAEVYVIEPLGAQTVIDVKIGDYIFKILMKGQLEYRIGEKILIRPQINRIHIFKNGKTII